MNARITVAFKPLFPATGCSAAQAKGFAKWMDHNTAPINHLASRINGSRAPINGIAPWINGSRAPINGIAPWINGLRAWIDGSKAPMTNSAVWIDDFGALLCPVADLQTVSLTGAQSQQNNAVLLKKERSEMTKTNSKTEAKRLTSARLIISNALKSPVTSKLLAPFGYDLARIREGESLLNTAEQLIAQHNKEYGDQYAATKVLNELYGKARAFYIEHVKLARMAQKKHSNLEGSLQLQGERKNTTSGWLAQASVFYDNALEIPEIKEALSFYGINEAILERGKKQVEAVAAALSDQKSKISVAQATTQEKNKAMVALNDWVGDFKSIARVALKDNPQLLEAFGIIISS